MSGPMDKVFRQMAEEHVALTTDSPARVNVLEMEFKKMYEAGRASMTLETELRKNLDKFINQPDPATAKKNITAIITEKMKEWTKRGLLGPDWKPDFRVEQSKEDPNRIEIIPNDVRTMRWFHQMKQPGGIDEKESDC